jgi:sterol desaturase/sphingolipid hydroxylase (fatty acid hydroxylase superfamily)
MIHAIFDKVGIPILILINLLLLLLETKFQLRKGTQKKRQRTIINTVVSIPAFALLRFAFLPIMVWIAYKNQDWQLGLNYFYNLPLWTKSIIAFLILDYGNYLWHILNHKIPFLWRFHLVHHTDPDMDITTAFRFHFGELIGSVFFRGAVTLLSGASPMLALVYEIIFEAATQFHHSNWKLPFAFERMLNKVFVTPRMHGIHHSVVKQETDSNYSVIFSFWDRLHRTARLNNLSDEVIVGVPSYNKPEELTIGFLLKLPFTKIRSWKKPEKKDTQEISKEKIS